MRESRNHNSKSMQRNLHVNFTHSVRFFSNVSRSFVCFETVITSSSSIILSWDLVKWLDSMEIVLCEQTHFVRRRCPFIGLNWKIDSMLFISHFQLFWKLHTSLFHLFGAHTIIYIPLCVQCHTLNTFLIVRQSIRHFMLPVAVKPIFNVSLKWYFPLIIE